MTVQTDPTGTFTFAGEDATSIELVLRGDAYVAVDRVIGPEGEELYWEDAIGPEQQTRAVYEVFGETVLVWPVSPGDYGVVVRTVDAAGEPVFATLEGRFTRKHGPGRTLRSTVVTSPGVELPEGALERWETVFRRAGVVLEVTVREDDALPTFAPAFESLDPVLAEVSEADGLVVWLAEEVAGRSTVGRAGNIPASTLPGTRGLVAVSAGLASGTDGEFTEAEAVALGDAIAHEVGHFLGLFHPVESTWDRYDALEETPTCSGQVACEQVLGGNLMFPYVVDDRTPRLTRDQRQLLLLHPAIE